MKPHPLKNALAAVTYIAAVALFMRFIESIRHDTPDTFLDGMGFLSLFVTSAAVMAYLFFYEPVRLLIEKRPAEAGRFLLQTIGAFAVCTALLLALASLQ